MPDQSRARRNPARFLAPIALIAVIAGTYVIVQHGLTSKKHKTQAAVTSHLTRSQRKYAKKRFYVVQAGDSLSVVSERTGIAVGTLEALNPSVDPNALHPGQRLRLRR
jgi:LysM repeat protein